MDRAEECVCCHEIPQVVNKNMEVFETDKLVTKPDCITDNPGFEAVCLNHWVLQVAWFHYKQGNNNMSVWQLRVENKGKIGMWLTDCWLDGVGVV